MHLTSETRCTEVRHSNPAISVTLPQLHRAPVCGTVDALLSGAPLDDPFLFFCLCVCLILNALLVISQFCFSCL